MRLRHAIPAAGATLALALALAGCSTSNEDHRGYLRTVAVRGAEAHSMIAVSWGTPDTRRCKIAYLAMKDDAPDDGGSLMDQEEWKAAVEAFFVDSCVSGTPKELPPQDLPVVDLSTDV